MHNLTTSETVVLMLMARNECCPQNSSDINETTTRDDLTSYSDATDYVTPELSINQVKGVMSSLVKKKLIRVDQEEPGMTVLEFTDAGFQLVKELQANEVK